VEPFQKVLIDSELFGHEKVTYWSNRHSWRLFFGGWRRDDFLDEVGDYSTKCAYYVFEKWWIYKSRFVTSSENDVRIVAATNVNIRCYRKRKFREDLYYRLSTVDITLPPLRDRKTIFICYSGNLLLILRINTAKTWWKCSSVTANFAGAEH
jgi:transcriptional regulator with GAF, ATPase, and Fis domain